MFWSIVSVWLYRFLIRLDRYAYRWRQANITPITKGPSPCSYYCLRYLSGWCRFDSDDLWIAVVCFQPPSLLIRKVWVPVMHFCACTMHCKVRWRVGGRWVLRKLTSAQPLIGSIIREFSISSAMWVLEVLCCMQGHIFCEIDHST